MKETKTKMITTPKIKKISRRDPGLAEGKIKNSAHANGQKGVALMTSIIIAAIMLTSVAAFSRDMIEEAINSTKIDNSLIAYYAAEAGIEDALLAWRYDKDSEISFENDSNPTVDVTADANNTPRCVDLDEDLSNYGRIDPSICASNYRDGTKRFYSLSMRYKNKCFGVATGCEPPPTIKRDDVAEFEIPSLNGTAVLTWEAQGIDQENTNSGMRVEITVFDEEGNIVDKNFTKTDITRYPIFNNNGEKRILRIKPWYTTATATGPNELYSEGAPNNDGTPSILFSMKFLSPNNFVSGQTSRIESIGYYGGVARKIMVDLDRTSGKIIGMLDYVIYSEADLSK